ncbi:MAG: DUF1361 domain-containing protein [Chitinophagales bacterium]
MSKKYLLQAKAGKIFSLRNEIDRVLIFSTLFSLGLILVRIVRTGHLTFLSLSWNLFLAWLPCLLTRTLASQSNRFRHPLMFWALFLLWLLFIPNSFYILTDLFHLEDGENDLLAPLWFDLILIVSVAWNGLVMGILSLRRMEKLMESQVRIKHELLFIFPVMWLNGLGVYIGRYLRFNSWDLFLNPFELIRDIGHILVHPFEYRMAWSMIFCFSVLLTFIYLMLKRIATHLP